MQTKTNALLLSTDTLPNYGLDLIFSIAKNTGFDGIDLAMRKGFDAWDDEYVQKLSKDYDMPVYIVQTSAKLNQKELDKALDLCQATNADTICVNAPKITDFKAYGFLLISNFTLYGRSTKGTKLDFVYSAPYKKAEETYNYFIQEAKNNGRKN